MAGQSTSRWLASGAALLLLGVAFESQTGEARSEPGQNALETKPSQSVAELKPKPPLTRLPAVAGLFYPADSRDLARQLDVLLDKAPAHYVPRLKALVCPHAGYEYSGATAAVAYKTLMGRPIETVVILAPSHYALFDGASIPDAGSYRTPLGSVPISEKARSLMLVPPFVSEPKCAVDRPSWWRQASRPAPDPGADTPETWEHSAEVQVPFLQRVLKEFKVLPVVLGRADPQKIAAALSQQIDEQTIIVASSDLSHYHPYAAARTLDSRCVKAICDVDIEQMKDQEACGKTPILSLLHLAKLKGWKAQLLDYRNSGDVSATKDRVVGYAGIAFYAPEQEQYGASERKQLLELARKAVLSAAGDGIMPGFTNTLPLFSEKRACFVTLTKAGSLRGCIGSLLPQSPLYQAVIDNARGAALRDPRFPPVQRTEVDQIRIEISVLTEPKPLSFASTEELLGKLQQYEDGVLLQIGPRMATFLPQVWAQIPEKVQFLEHLAQKAGCAPDAWRGKDVSVSVYHVECFEEPDPALRN
jgi:MEMO1 family protein